MTSSTSTSRTRRSPATREGGASQKGRQTRAAIVDTALGLAAQIGLEGLSIGALADAAHMSKSGVFAHFGSREDLQIAVIQEYHARFEAEVFAPAMRHSRGLPRLGALVENWMKRTTVEIDSGCIYISGAVEFDDRPGPVRDALVESVGIWMAAVRRAIVGAREQGHLDAGTDPEQLLFEIHGLILALHYEARLLRKPGAAERAQAAFQRIVDTHRTAGDTASQATSHHP